MPPENTSSILNSITKNALQCFREDSMKTKIHYIITLFALFSISIYATPLKVESTPALQLTTTQLTYSFTLQQPMTVVLHHWESASTATRITLKDSEGNIIDTKYGSWDIDDSPNLYQSYLKRVLPRPHEWL